MTGRKERERERDGEIERERQRGRKGGGGEGGREGETERASERAGKRAECKFEHEPECVSVVACTCVADIQEEEETGSWQGLAHLLAQHDAHR